MNSTTGGGLTTSPIRSGHIDRAFLDHLRRLMGALAQGAAARIDAQAAAMFSGDPNGLDDWGWLDGDDDK